MKKQIIFFTAIMLCLNSYAQSHDYTIGCRFSKNYRNEAEVKKCPACIKDREDEKKAKVAEDKRRVAVEVAKGKAEKEALDSEAKRQEERRKEEIAKNKTIQISTPTANDDESATMQSATNDEKRKIILSDIRLIARKDEHSNKYGYVAESDYKKWIIEPVFDYGASFEGNYATVGFDFLDGGNRYSEDDETKCNGCIDVASYAMFRNVIDRSGKLLFNKPERGDYFIIMGETHFVLKFNSSSINYKWACSAEIYNLVTLKVVATIEPNYFYESSEYWTCNKRILYTDDFSYITKEDLKSDLYTSGGNRQGFSFNITAKENDKNRLDQLFSEGNYSFLMTYITNYDNENSYPVSGFLFGLNGEFKSVSTDWIRVYRNRHY